MIKIRVSYEHPEELQKVIKKLGNDVKKIKQPMQQDEKKKKAYIDMV